MSNNEKFVMGVDGILRPYCPPELDDPDNFDEEGNFMELAPAQQMTDLQLAALALLAMSLNITPRTQGYLDLFTHRYQPQYVTADWLAQLERTNPGVTVKYWAIVNEMEGVSA